MQFWQQMKSVVFCFCFSQVAFRQMPAVLLYFFTLSVLIVAHNQMTFAAWMSIVYVCSADCGGAYRLSAPHITRPNVVLRSQTSNMTDIHLSTSLTDCFSSLHLPSTNCASDSSLNVLLFRFAECLAAFLSGFGLSSHSLRLCCHPAAPHLPHDFQSNLSPQQIFSRALPHTAVRHLQ